MPLEKQVVILYAAINGYIDDIAIDKVGDFETGLHRFMESSHPEIGTAIAREKEIRAETEEALKAAIVEFEQSHYSE
jgi:F-type H+-transporting ATPase subunit alpha